MDILSDIMKLPFGSLQKASVYVSEHSCTHLFDQECNYEASWQPWTVGY